MGPGLSVRRDRCTGVRGRVSEPRVYPTGFTCLWGGDESPRGRGRHLGASRSVWRNHTGQRSSPSPPGLLYVPGPWQEGETLHTGPRVAFHSLPVASVTLKPDDRATHSCVSRGGITGSCPVGAQVAAWLAMNRGTKAGDLSRWAWHGQPGTSHGPGWLPSERRLGDPCPRRVSLKLRINIGPANALLPAPLLPRS